MGSRVERYREKKKRKKIYKIRTLIVIFMIIALFGGLNIVDKTYKSMMNNNDKSLFKYDYVDSIHNLQLFGQNYSIEHESILNIVDKGKEFLLNVKDKIIQSFNKIKRNILNIINSSSSIYEMKAANW